MAAGKYNFTLEQGNTLDFELIYKDSNSNPIDLSGYEGKMEIRSAYSGSGITYLTFTSSLGDTYSKEINNSFLSFSGSNLELPTASGSIGVYAGYQLTGELTFSDSAYYDIEITSGSIRERLLEGRINLSTQITD